MSLLFSLDGKVEVIACLFVLFGCENESYEFLWKTISNMADSSKNILKNKNAPIRTREKSHILQHRFLDEYT